MRILLLNDYLALGGAEIQLANQKRVLELAGHEVHVLTFDERLGREPQAAGLAAGHSNIPIRRSHFGRTLARLGIRLPIPWLTRRVRRAVEAVRPDVIHANNLNKAPLEVYRVLSRYPVVQTLHDFAVVCPAETCVRPAGLACGGFAHSDCWQECHSVLGRRWRLRLWEQVRTARLASVTRLVTPSLALRTTCADNGIDTVCINNPFTGEIRELPAADGDEYPRRYLYAGAVTGVKGVFQLIEAFQRFQAGKPVELLIAGRLGDDARQRLPAAIAACEAIRYIGELSHADLQQQLARMHALIVPSVWQENYPTIVLEGMAQQVLVIGSKRGGIPELLGEGRGLTFDVLDIEDLTRTLQQSFELEPADYRRMVAAAAAYVRSNNAPESYGRQLVGELAAAIREQRG